MATDHCNSSKILDVIGINDALFIVLKFSKDWCGMFLKFRKSEKPHFFFGE